MVWRPDAKNRLMIRLAVSREYRCVTDTTRGQTDIRGELYSSAICTMADEQEVIAIWSVERRHFQWPWTILNVLANSYRAMLCIAWTMPSQDVFLSVRPSVTRRYSVKSVNVLKLFNRLVGTSVFAFTKRCGNTPSGTPPPPITGASNARGTSKFAIFDEYLALSSFLCNRDLHTPYSRVSFRMILNDFEWLAIYSMTRNIARSLCCSWASCFSS